MYDNHIAASSWILLASCNLSATTPQKRYLAIHDEYPAETTTSQQEDGREGQERKQEVCLWLRLSGLFVSKQYQKVLLKKKCWGPERSQSSHYFEQLTTLVTKQTTCTKAQRSIFESRTFLTNCDIQPSQKASDFPGSSPPLRCYRMLAALSLPPRRTAEHGSNSGASSLQTQHRQEGRAAGCWSPSYSKATRRGWPQQTPQQGTEVCCFAYPAPAHVEEQSGWLV